MATKQLSARQVETAKPKEKAYTLFDGGGLHLLVNANGSKLWRMFHRSILFYVSIKWCIPIMRVTV